LYTDKIEEIIVSIAERTKQRKQRIVSNRSHSFEEAEHWDLEFWQKQSPEARLSALVAIRRDVLKVAASRGVHRSR